jgi:hypothetical protein
MQVHHNPVDQPGRHHGNAAYTLVEVLCSVFITATVVAILFVGFDNGFSILRTTREDLRATQILMQRTEAFRLYTWPQLAKLTNNPYQEYYNPAGGTNRGTLYWINVSANGVATNIPDTAETAYYKSNLHLITITVNWTNRINSKPVAHMRQMQTLSAISGMQNYLFSGAITN